jgi:hypothetical protein
MHYTISNDLIERLKTHLAGAIDEVDEADALYQELQVVLEQPEGKPVCYVQLGIHGRVFSMNDSKDSECVTPLYTHPEPFTPITADMVTNDVLRRFLGADFDYIQLKTSAIDSYISDIVKTVNAWGAKK